MNKRCEVILNLIKNIPVLQSLETLNKLELMVEEAINREKEGYTEALDTRTFSDSQNLDPKPIYDEASGESGDESSNSEEIEDDQQEYPYQVFQRTELAELDQADKDSYSACLGIANDNPILAYFFYKNKSLRHPKSFTVYTTLSKEIEIAGGPKEYIKRGFNFEGYKETTAKFKYSSSKKYLSLCYGYGDDRFPPFDKEGKYTSAEPLTKDEIEILQHETMNHPQKCDFLLVYLLYTWGIDIHLLEFVRFEDFSKESFNFEHGSEKFEGDISRRIYERIRVLQNSLAKKGKLKTETRDGKTGHFVFNFGERGVYRKFKRGFGIENFRIITPKQLLVARNQKM